MPIAAEDIPKLKPWLIKRSGELSDAEPDVLADYVIALLNNKVEGDELVKLLEEQLDDFLENSKSFAFEIVNVLKTRAFEEESARLTGNKAPFDQQGTQNLPYKPDQTHYKNGADNKRNQRAQQHIFTQQNKGSTLENNSKHQQRENLKSIISQNEVPNAKHLIVANLPSDKLDEQLIRAYFSRFGAIDNVLIDLTSRIAEIEFANPFSAKKAYGSSAPIFDNRFIKVFFRKKDAERNKEKEEKPFDLDEFKKKQLEKQKEFEERLAKKKAQDAKLKEMIALKEKMLANFEKELLKLEEEFKSNPENEASIKAKLDSIQSEMQQLGITPDAIAADKARLDGIIPMVPKRGRGAPRGRGASARGGTRGGRGGFTPYARPNASYNRKLDLRTRTVTIKNLPSANNEEFSRHLRTFGEENVANITNKSPSSINVTFNDRFHAERFFKEDVSIEGIGSLEKEWDESIRPTAPQHVAPNQNQSAQPTPPPSNSETDLRGNEATDVEMV